MEARQLVCWGRSLLSSGKRTLLLCGREPHRYVATATCHLIGSCDCHVILMNWLQCSIQLSEAQCHAHAQLSPSRSSWFNTSMAPTYISHKWQEMAKSYAGALLCNKAIDIDCEGNWKQVLTTIEFLGRQLSSWDIMICHSLNCWSDVVKQDMR